jgi:Phage integrase family
VLRHTFCTHLADAGTIRELAGHADIRTTTIYTAASAPGVHGAPARHDTARSAAHRVRAAVLAHGERVVDGSRGGGSHLGAARGAQRGSVTVPSAPSPARFGALMPWFVCRFPRMAPRRHAAPARKYQGEGQFPSLDGSHATMLGMQRTARRHPPRGPEAVGRTSWTASWIAGADRADGRRRQQIDALLVDGVLRELRRARLLAVGPRLRAPPALSIGRRAAA